MPSGRLFARYAAMEISPKFLALSGTPFTKTLPPSTTMSAGDASRRCAPICTTFWRTFSAAFGAALLEAFVVGHRKRAVERGCVIAAVVGDPAYGVERERVGWNEVLASDLRGVHTDLVGEPVHDPFDQQRGLGPARAPVRVDRGGVGVRAAHLVIERGDPVRAWNDEHVEDGRNAWRERL